MRLRRCGLFITIAAWGLVTTAGFADTCDFEEFNDELDERDFEAVVEYVNTKRIIELEEKACKLVISGDIRAEWSHITEKLHGQRLRGSRLDRCGAGFLSNNDFDIDVNLYFEYKCERAWGVVHVEFDNPAGVQEGDKICGVRPLIYDRCSRIDPDGCFGSGDCNRLCLRKAFMGYNICSDGKTRLDIEVGRRRLYDVFDSRIQFLARFDGLVLRYATQWKCTDFYWNLGGFVVDERVNHFSFVTEFGALRIAETGLDLKYSFINWFFHGRNRCDVAKARGWRFDNSQVTIAYRFDPDYCQLRSKVYGAFIVNHAAQRLHVTRNKKENIAWYVGFLFGEVIKEGDWSVDCNYQYCEAQAVPDCDLSGIGRGNFFKETFTMGGPDGDPFNARGDANYKGMRLEGLYALTDDLSIDAVFQYSVPADKAIGGPMNYSKFKVEAIYAF
jgi:hypothetical protein